MASGGNQQVVLSWTVPPSDGGSPITGYNVYRGSSPGGESPTSIGTAASGTSFTDNGLTDGTTYYYTVTAVNSVGESPQAVEVSATPQAVVPSAPTGLMASGGNQQIVLSWTVPPSDGGSPITGYNVYRGTIAGGELSTPVATNVPGTSFTDTGLTNGTTYYYTVAAVSSAGTSPQSAEMSATPATVPSAPQSLTATAGNGVATLSWSAPASNGGAVVTGYDVYRGTAPGGESTTPVASGITALSFTDTGLTNGNTYYYTVAAVNAAGVSPQSAEASAALPVIQLCTKVQPYPSITDVTPGGTASFIVWVWSTGATSTNVSVVASLGSASFLGAPTFAICPSASGATCKIASIPVGQVYELLASVPVSSAAPDATSVAFTAQASASGAVPFSASATEVVATASTATSPPSSSSDVPPLISLPPIPGTSVSAVNPSELFPTVSPAPGSGTLGLPAARSGSGVHATVVSSTVPIDARLIGAQLIGLAVLAGAVSIAIMRMSLRRRPAAPTAAPPADAGQKD